MVWYSCSAFDLVLLGFDEAKSGISLFIIWRGTNTVYLPLYIDAIMLMASNLVLLQRMIASM